MNALSSVSNWLRRSGWILLLIALGQFVLHLWANAHDTFFRDELYYLAAARHLSPGYVEYPPFIALAMAFSRTVFGSSVLAIRLLPALTGALMVLLTADMAAQLGGGLPAQVLAALAIALGPVFIGSSGLMSMDPFDQFWWTLAAWVLVRLIRRQQPRLWLAFGLVVGLGLLTKLTMGFFAMALMLGLLLSGQRRLLFNRWLLLGGVIAFVLFSPYLVWQLQHGFPVLEYTRSYSLGNTYHQDTPLEYFGEQLVTVNPIAFPLWLGGLVFLFFVPAGRPYRAFAWAYVFLYAFFMLAKAKYYWLSPAYPMLFASGSYALQWLVEHRPRLSRLQTVYLLLLSATGLLLLPFAIPLLPLDVYLRYSHSSALPQVYADRYGWRGMVTAVKSAYDTLTPREQAEACIYASNYGEAGAVDFYGPALGLPKAISGHNSYFIWGPQGCTGQVIITINVSLQTLAGSFESVEPAGHTSCNWCMSFENNAPINIARGLKVPFGTAWPGVKIFE